MNALQQFNKDHPLLFHAYLVILCQALVPGVDAAYQELINPSHFPLTQILSVSALTFLVSLFAGIAHYVATDTSMPEVNSVVQMVLPVIQQQFSVWLAAQQNAQQTPVGAKQPQPIQLPQAPTYSSTPVGTQIANNLIRPSDPTWNLTTQMPVQFPVPQQAPIAADSAFHSLLPTQSVPVPPPVNNAAFLNSAPPTQGSTPAQG